METEQEELEIWSVEEWLEKIGMSDYTDGFMDNGYETIELIGNMKGEDMDAVGVANKHHRGILFTQARLLLEETVGVQSPHVAVPPSPKPVITLSMSGSVSPTTPSSTGGYSEPWSASSGPMQSPSTINTDYTEPWNTSSGPLQSPTNKVGYTEPWNASASTTKSNGVGSNSLEGTDGATTSTGNTKPPPLPPPNKPKKTSKKPPPSPGMKLPEYKRENGDKGLTKLQLKLKIREELQKDAIVLSDHPYCTEDGNENEGKLIDLATEYAGRFRVESLGVYDALRDVWRHATNKSEFATPSALRGKAIREEEKSTGVVLLGGPTDNYDEPFDAQSSSVPNNALRQALTSSGSPKDQNVHKSRTLPPTNTQSLVYDEPFDSKNAETNSSQKQQTRIVKNESKTLPSPKVQRHAPSETPDDKKTKKQSTDKSVSPSSSPPPKHGGGLSRYFKRNKDKTRSQSVKEIDSVKHEGKKGGKQQALIRFPKPAKDSPWGKKKHSSAENLKEIDEDKTSDVTTRKGRPTSRSARASVAGYPFQNGSSSRLSPKRRPTTSSGSSGPSETEDSPNPRKKYEGKVFQKFITPPTLKRNQSPDYPCSSESENEGTPPALRKLRSLNNRTGSDLELSTTVDDGDSKAWMQMSKSYDNLAETLAEEKRKAKKKGFFQRFLTIRKSMNVGSRKKSKGKVKFQESSRGSCTSTASSENRLSSLTASISMPDIASLSVLDRKQGSPTIAEDSVFDSSKQTPPKPSHSVKWSPESTPVINSSPATHHRMIIRGLSDSSTPDNHSIPIHSTSLQNNFSSSPTDGPYYTSAANTIPSGNSLDSEDPIPRSLKRDSNVSLTRTGSGGSTKSLDLPRDGSLTRRPQPPPKPSKLTAGKVAPSQKTSPMADVSLPQSPSQLNDQAPSSKPSPGPVKQELDSPSTRRPPPKPARTSMKRSGVTEQQRKEIQSGVTEQQRKEIQTVTPPSDDVVRDEKPPQKPPPKPTRNYKSVKILSSSPRPEDNTPKSKTLGDRISSSENIKPSELLRRSRSPAQSREANSFSPDPTPLSVMKSDITNGNRRDSTTSSGSNFSQSDSDRPTPKPRSISGSLSGKQAPPVKPPRQSVKLKNPAPVEY